MGKSNLMTGKKTEMQMMVERLYNNRSWLDQNIDSISDQYQVGTWVAVADGKVVGHGETPDDLLENSGKNISDETIIVCVPDKDIPEPV